MPKMRLSLDTKNAPTKDVPQVQNNLLGYTKVNKIISNIAKTHCGNASVLG